MIDLENLVTIVNFIVDVYAPFWFQIHLNPRLPSGPANILFARDLLLGHENEELFHHILPYFQSHALTWLSPKNLCVSVYSESPPMPIEDVRKIRTMHVDVEDLLWSSRPLKAFFTIESQCAPCISHGNYNYWNSVDNHNRSCERLIGVMKDIIGKGKI